MAEWTDYDIDNDIDNVVGIDREYPHLAMLDELLMWHVAKYRQTNNYHGKIDAEISYGERNEVIVTIKPI